MTRDEFRKARTALGLTQGALAERLGVSQGAVCRWEIGTRPIAEPVARLLRLLVDTKPTKGRQARRRR